MSDPDNGAGLSHQPKLFVFGGETYGPKGGWNDLISVADTMEEALRQIVKAPYRVDWWHVVNAQTMKIVAEDGDE